MSNTRRLNIGCGTKRLPDAVNLDISGDVGADVVHDLNCRPWPFSADAFDEIYAYDLLEHLDDVVATLQEVHRISRDGAVFHLTVPHFSCSNSFTDVTHRHYFGWQSFDPFVDSPTGRHALAHYSRLRFRLASAHIYFHPSLATKIVARCANCWPQAYERRWAWIFPAWFMAIDLEVSKANEGPCASLGRPATG